MINITNLGASRTALTLLAFLTFALLATTLATSCGGESSPKQGADAPEFSLPVANGAGKIALSQYRGEKNVVLVFYRGFF